MKRRYRLACLHAACLIAAFVLGAGPVAAIGERRVKLIDMPLLDASGRQQRFVSDAVADAIIVLNLIWTGCSSFCPLTSAVMADLAERLGDRLTGDVRLVSLAIDPLEAPQRQLESWITDYGEVPGWLWLGGRPEALEAVLGGLGEPLLPDFESHPAVFMVIDGRDGRSVRFDGLETDSAVLAQAIDRLRPEP